MADKGWIKLNRQIMDHWMYQDKPFNRSMAWIDLLLLADHKTHKSLWRGNLVEFKRGDVNLSLRELGERWGWSKEKVRNFISTLEADGMVTTNITKVRTVLTLVKYDDFQIRPTSEQTSDSPSKQTSEQISDSPYLKNNKEINKNKKKPTSQLHQFEQNKYDFAKLEQQLLERG